MKTVLIDCVISVLCAAVAVALVWLVSEAVVTTHADRVSPRVVLESIAFLPVAVFIFAAAALMAICETPCAAAMLAATLGVAIASVLVIGAVTCYAFR